MKLFKLLIRTILLPVCLFMLLVKVVLNLGTTFTSWLLSILSLVFTITGIFVIFAEGMLSGVTILVLAWLVSPFGLLCIADALVDLGADVLYKLRARLA